MQHAEQERHRTAVNPAVRSRGLRKNHPQHRDERCHDVILALAPEIHIVHSDQEVERPDGDERRNNPLQQRNECDCERVSHNDVFVHAFLLLVDDVRSRTPSELPPPPGPCEYERNWITYSPYSTKMSRNCEAHHTPSSELECVALTSSRVRRAIHSRSTCKTLDDL